MLKFVGAGGSGGSGQVGECFVGGQVVGAVVGEVGSGLGVLGEGVFVLGSVFMRTVPYHEFCIYYVGCLTNEV